MRIGNPPPIQSSTIQISRIDAPTQFATLSTITLTSATSTDIAPLTDQCELTLSNISSSGEVFVRSADGTTAETGILLGSKATAVLNLNATVRLLNNSGSTVRITGTQTGYA